MASVVRAADPGRRGLSGLSGPIPDAAAALMSAPPEPARARYRRASEAGMTVAGAACMEAFHEQTGEEAMSRCGITPYNFYTWPTDTEPPLPPRPENASDALWKVLAEYGATSRANRKDIYVMVRGSTGQVTGPHRWTLTPDLSALEAFDNPYGAYAWLQEENADDTDANPDAPGDAQAGIQPEAQWETMMLWGGGIVAAAWILHRLRKRAKKKESNKTAAPEPATQ